MLNVPLARPMRRAMMTAALLSATALTACSQAPDDRRDASASSEAVASDAATPATRDAAASASADAADIVPGLDNLATSGVALTYSFAFRLADDKVAEAQDRHLRACEQLGQVHCVVGDVAFDRNENGTVSGRTSFLLDPAMARNFVRDANSAVASLDGETLTSSVRGEELARGINDSQTTSARLGTDVARLRQRLARPGLSTGERRDLQAQIDAIDDQLRSEETNRRGAERRLANTPVAFDYSGTTGFAGIDSGRPFASAWSASSSSVASAGAVLLTLLGIALPWLLIIAGIVAAIRGGQRWLRRRGGAVNGAAPSLEVPPTPA
jgi:hypothetical protein